MNYYDVSMVGNVGKYRDVLTYQHPNRLDTGTLVDVPVGQQTSLGVVTRRITKPDFVCKDISRVVIERPLPSQLVQLTHRHINQSTGIQAVRVLISEHVTILDTKAIILAFAANKLTTEFPNNLDTLLP